MRTQRLLTVLALGLLTLAVTQCGSSSPAPTSPSPTPSPAPSPSPAPGGSGNSLSVSPQTIQGQGQPQATVTLASAAPSGGALVLLASDSPTVVKVPATVTVPSGSRSTTFLVDTSTVTSPATVRITASYGGTSMSTTVTVTPPGLVASFVVRSPTRGTGACLVDTETQEVDCVLDGSGSQGFVSAYLWTYTMGSTTLRHTAAAPNAASRPQGTGCSLYQQGSGGDDPNGDRYLKMEVTLQVRDGSSALSDVVRQQVKVYPNKQCGFSY
jgi:hypothetical protein